ncbi:subtilisin-like protein [Lactarius akahatsu]|uniref:tripeptidyl-peptidase II n=1 Tax=Lactarius akahatsu TaxID=416441 RepID=A0AAD4QA48_9AGAM|nr:subtilisin-like protein [Lactarius akahatsu]
MHCHPISALSTLAVAILCGLATPLAPPWDGMKLMHAWSTVPKNWESLGHPPNETAIDLYLALKSERENALVDVLYQVSDPKSPTYGAHLSREQVAEVVAPHPDTLYLVSSWLKHWGIPSSSVSTALGGNWLKVVGVSVSHANDILGASYQLYQHVETNNAVIRTISYSLPEVLHGHIQAIVPTTHFGYPLTERIRLQMDRSVGVEARAKEVLSSRDESVVPSHLRWLYRTSGYVPKATDRNALGIAGYGSQYPSPQDLAAFMVEYRTEGEDARFDVVQINGGGYDPNKPGLEGSLDIQYAEAMAYPTPHIYYSTGGTEKSLTDDPYIRWLDYLLDEDNVNIPQTISTSYGGYEHFAPLEYATEVCDLFSQLGARGVSVLFASGDWGVGGGDCLVQSSSGNTYYQFLPVFPASCTSHSPDCRAFVGPWVTSVGGTTSHNPEVAASLSGGGFSVYFDRPEYQEGVIPTFFQSLGDTYEGFYDPNGRGFPDVSAQAVGLPIVLRGKVKHVEGTSGSAPTVAGIISLLNDYLISKGSQPLGFLNPWLYGTGRPGLNDITSGSNPGCNTKGFTAIAGWDPVSGHSTSQNWRK